MPYKVLLLCSISVNDTYIIEMLEKSLSAQDFEYITIGKNPYVDLDKDILLKSLNWFDVLLIVITNVKYVNLINKILEDNIIFLSLKKKPVMLISSPEIIKNLRNRATHTEVYNTFQNYPILEIQPKINEIVLKLKDIIDRRKDQEALASLGLIAGGIAIGAGLLFYLFGGNDE